MEMSRLSLRILLLESKNFKFNMINIIKYEYL